MYNVFKAIPEDPTDVRIPPDYTGRDEGGAQAGAGASHQPASLSTGRVMQEIV